MSELRAHFHEALEDFPDDQRLTVGAGLVGSLLGAEVAHVLADEPEDHHFIEFGMGCGKDAPLEPIVCRPVESTLNAVSSSVSAVPHHALGAVTGGTVSLAVALGASWFMNKLIREGID